jgi:hypothetical protein
MHICFNWNNKEALTYDQTFLDNKTGAICYAVNAICAGQGGGIDGSESIEWFTEDKAFSPSPFLPSVRSTGDTQEGCLRETSYWRGDGRGAESYDRKKPGPL